MSDELDFEKDVAEEHLADTNPMRPITPSDELPAWRRMAGFISLFGAAGLTVASFALLLIPVPAQSSDVPEPTAAITQEIVETLPTVVSVDTSDTNNSADQIALAPTISPDAIAQILEQPLAPVAVENGFTFVRNSDNPFTRVPDRPRSEITEYEVVSGDTLFTIAERFGLKPESIAWSNPRSIIGGLQPGLMLTIPPVDGAVELIANDRTIANLAAGYSVDPYAIIDWESNFLYNASPDTILVSGLRIFIPGGQGEQISWTPRVERSGNDSSGAGGTISFAVGEPGSCGQQPNPGGFGGWTRPLSSYTWVRGFINGVHTGVDLSVPVGTPVYAALGGTVIFRGWNSFGYGYAIVLAHGPFTTIYGHLSDYAISCGQSVSPGQVIGYSGNSGNSSGPHLHFEVRYNDIAQDPTTIMAF